MARTERDLSIVIPTRDRWPVLAGTLDALAAQSIDGLEVEVVVADNGSADDTWRRLGERASAGRDPFELRPVREPRPGASAARNAGIAAARGGLVLFLGDDCRPSSRDLLRAHLEHYGDGDPWRAVLGHVEWDPAVGSTPVMRWLDRTGKTFTWPSPGETDASPWFFYTSNVSVSREALVAVDGFDERFPAYGWEDGELGLRLEQRGLRLAYRPELRVVHAHRYELSDSLKRMEAVGRTLRLVHRLHGETASPRPRPRGPAPALARLGLPVAARLPAPRPGSRVEDLWLRGLHLGALARGYAAPALPDQPWDRGGIGSRAEPSARPERPGVSIVVPFAGPASDLADLARALASLNLRDADEVVIVDNTEAGVDAASAEAAGRVVRASAERSSYYARNVGAENASCPWLLLLDADCRPPPSLIDDFFAEPPGDRVGAIAGQVVGDPSQEGLLPAYARSRRLLDQVEYFRHPYRPFVVTACLLVRREAWESVGGFATGIRSGGDTDFSWRLQEGGWTIAVSDHAWTTHLHRTTVRGLVRQNLRYGAGQAWVRRRHPGSLPRRPIARTLARSAIGAVGWTVLLQPERAAFKALDGVVVVSEAVGNRRDNRPRGR